MSKDLLPAMFIHNIKQKFQDAQLLIANGRFVERILFP